MTPLRRTQARALGALILMSGLAACGSDAPSPPPADNSGSLAPSPSVRSGTTTNDLSAIACATDDPTNLGPLTGAWRGSTGAVYYIRHVGDCVWWFGTEISEVDPGQTGQGGFANVASGRVNGPLIQVEWADLPLGNILGGGGLTLVYDEGSDQLWVTQQRGHWQPFGDTTLTRIHQQPTPSASASQ